jgi:hypothetical protein
MSDTATRFKTLLQSNAAVTAKVGKRVHMDKVPQNEPMPYVFFRRGDAAPIDTLDATAGESPTNELFNVQVVSDKKGEAEAIADLICKSANSGLALNAYRGTFGDSTCQGIFVTGRESEQEGEGIGEGAGVYTVPFTAQVYL